MSTIKKRDERSAEKINEDKMLKRRLLMSVLGVLISGLSVGLFKRASLGVDPFQSLMSGLDAVLPIRFGTLYVIVCALLLLFSLITDRRKIGIATLINLFFFGYVAEFSLGRLQNWFPDLSLTGRFVMLILGIVIMCFASAFYFTADMGVSVYDAISLIVSERQRKVPFRFCRIISDLVCVSLGTALCLLSGMTWREVTGSVGIGTIITAFFMGPLIEFFKIHAAVPFLDKAPVQRRNARNG